MGGLPTKKPPEERAALKVSAGAVVECHAERTRGQRWQDLTERSERISLNSSCALALAQEDPSAGHSRRDLAAHMPTVDQIVNLHSYCKRWIT
jgi:hypothetical protein